MILFADRPGAVLDAGGVPIHFGEPIREQRGLQRGALVPLPREVIRLSGPDRLSWLDSITSQRLTLSAGESTENLVLSPQGKVEHAMRLTEDGDSLWAIVDADRAASLKEFLERMRFMRQVDIELVEDVAVVGVSGDVDAPQGIVWTDSWPLVAEGGVRYGSYEGDDPWRWREIIVSADDAARLGGEELTVVGYGAYEAARVAAGRPSIADVDERAIPHELDWLATAVHLDKGCYRGQETVAKVHNLGAPPRRLTLLHLDGSDSVMPMAGAEVTAGEKSAGHVTSVAYHYDLGPIALALLKRSIDPEAVLTVHAGEDGTHEVTATQEMLVPPTAGHANRPPRLPRLGAVKRPQR